MPEGLHDDTKKDEFVECYTDEQLDRVQSTYLKDKNLPNDTSIITVINQGDSCSMLNGGAAGIVDNINGLRIGTMYADSFTRKVILHEEGHVLGLSHAATASCKPSYDSESYVEMAKEDISKLIDNGCSVPETGGKARDMYSDQTTVMGGIPYDVRNADDYFSSVEMTKIVPEIAQNKDIDTENATYTISLRHHQLRTVSLTLPKEHPLRKIDPNIDTLSIGSVSVDGGTRSYETVQLIAHHDGQSYRLTETYPYVASLDKDKGPVEFYHDETLGIKVLLSPNQDGHGVNVTIEKIY
jgi:hypothetical protein